MKSLIVIFLILIISGSVSAQKQGDHPLIGRVEGSSMEHQEISNFNQYNLGLGKIVNDTVSNILKLEGKVTMTWYKAVDLSSFEITSAYREMLKSKGFEMVFTCDKGDCGNNASGKFYSLAPFISDYGYANSAPFTNSGNEATFISVAKRITDKTAIYVSIIVTQGWWQHPVYKVDVLEIVKKELNIVSNEGEKNKPDDEKVSSEIKETKDKDDFRKFSFKAGLGAFSLNDPMIAGVSQYFTTYDNNGNGFVSGEMSGFRFMTGPYFNFRYFINSNIGFSIDVNIIQNSEEVEWTDDFIFKSNASFAMEKVGIVGILTGEDVPFSFSTTFGAGHCKADLYMAKEPNPGVNQSGLYLIGEGSYPVYFMNFDATYPIFKGFGLTGQLEYNLIPANNFYMKHDGGNEYQLMYKNVNFGGFHFRINLSYSF